MGSTWQCAYRDESDLSHESRKLVIEVVRILNSIPAAEAVRTLRLLGTETNAPIILSTLRDEATARSEPSTESSTGAGSNDTSEPLEFEVQHPIAYPTLLPSDHQKLKKQPYAGRYEPETQELSFYS